RVVRSDPRAAPETGPDADGAALDVRRAARARVVPVPAHARPGPPRADRAGEVGARVPGSAVLVKLAVGLGGANEDWEAAGTWLTEVERLGVGSAWGGETWGFDAFTPVAYLASRTQQITLGTAIAQVGSRSPAALAMTALAMASMTGDRFVLGLGT